MLRDEKDVDSVLIADMGSHGLRKYASFFMGYNQTNVWSPPEVLGS